MNDRVFAPFSFLTTWPAAGALVVLFVLCQLGFEQRSKALGRQHEVLDARRWYTPREARDLLDDLGERGRCLYASTELTLDLLFPVVYAGLFAGLIGNLYPRRTARGLVAIPICGALADCCENVSAAYLAWSFDGQEDPVAGVATVATLVKSVLFILSMVAIAVGVIRSVRRGSQTRP